MLSSKAMSNRFRVSSTLPRKLKELGLSPDVVLRRADLPIGLFKLDRIQVSTEQFFALHRGIAEASNDPAIAADCVGVELKRHLDVAVAKQTLHRLWIGSDPDDALVIALADDEKRDDIDFTVQPSRCHSETKRTTCAKIEAESWPQQ